MMVSMWFPFLYSLGIFECPVALSQAFVLVRDIQPYLGKCWTSMAEQKGNVLSFGCVETRYAAVPPRIGPQQPRGTQLQPSTKPTLEAKAHGFSTAPCR